MSSKRLREVIVVGCGVVGLTTAIELMERGWRRVSIVARDLPPHTTSNVAAAIWYPYKVPPTETIGKWAQISLDRLSLLAGVPGSGVSPAQLVELFTVPTEEPWWRTAVPGFRRAAAVDMPPGYVDGFIAEVPVIETPIYMRYLLERFASLGGRIHQRELQSLAELCEAGNLVINCAGLGARSLVDDQRLYPIRGQVVRVERPSGFHRWLIDETSPDRPTYIISRSTDCVLGGTAEEGRWELAPDQATTEQILERCLRLAPELQRGLKVLDTAVGLRPGREGGVRLELERLENTVVIHNYGHGGAGFTLSWGCAAAVADLAEISGPGA